MKTVPFPVKEEVETNAASWVAKIDRGLNDDERMQIEEWLQASPMHGEALVKCASMWDLLDVLNSIATLLPREKSIVDRDATLEGVNQKSLTKKNNAKDGGFNVRFQSFPWAMVASLVLAVGIVTLSVKPFFGESDIVSITSVDNPVQDGYVEPYQVYKTAIGELSSVTLLDGSTLKINTNSEVKVSFSEAERTLDLLKGEVFFEVAKNPERPFVVNVGDEKVIAIGTAFSIDSNNGLSTEVLVTEGKVKVMRAIENAYDDLFLTSGQQVMIVDNNPQLLSDPDVDAMLAWRDGILIFQGESLAQAIKEINRYTELRLKIIDNNVTDISVGGFFKAGDTEQLLLILEQNFGVASQRVKDEVLLYQASP